MHGDVSETDSNISDREELLCMQAKFLHLRLDMNPFKDEMDMTSPPSS